MRSRRVRLAASSASAWTAASAGSSASRRRAASSASPTRPAAFSRGAMAKDTVSRSTAAGAIAGTLQEGRDAGPWSRPEAFEPEPGDGAVLADDRGHVRHRPDRGEVGQGERRGRTAGLVREQELGDLECDATPRQPPVRVGRVGAMRIDDRERVGQDGRDAMVVGDDDVDATRVRDRDLGHARRAAVDGDDEAGPGRDGRVDRGERQTVPLVQPARDVWLDRHAEPAQRDGHDRQPGQSISVEVAEDQDPLRALACEVQTVGGARPHPADVAGRAGHRADRRTRRRCRRRSTLRGSRAGRSCGRTGPARERRQPPPATRSRRRKRSSGSGVRPSRQDDTGGCTADWLAGCVVCLRPRCAGPVGCASWSDGRDGGHPTGASPRATGSPRRSTSRFPR